MLYHSPVGSDHGDQILPLNLMRESFPDLHATHYAKYVGRESALGQTIPPLSCTWGDVAFLSPVDSGLLFDALRQSGRSVPSLPFCTLDASVLDPDRTWIRLMRKFLTGPEAEPASGDDFLTFTTATLRAVSRVTHTALERPRNLTAHEPMLPWVDLPHILHRGPVPIAPASETLIDTLPQAASTRPARSAAFGSGGPRCGAILSWGPSPDGWSLIGVSPAGSNNHPSTPDPRCRRGHCGAP